MEADKKNKSILKTKAYIISFISILIALIASETWKMFGLSSIETSNWVLSKNPVSSSS